MSLRSLKRHHGANKIILLIQYSELGFGYAANKGVVKPNPV
jgi:hypothetical protein